jgi:hypothetical protein
MPLEPGQEFRPYLRYCTVAHQCHEPGKFDAELQDIVEIDPVVFDRGIVKSQDRFVFREESQAIEARPKAGLVVAIDDRLRLAPEEGTPLHEKGREPLVLVLPPEMRRAVRRPLLVIRVIRLDGIADQLRQCPRVHLRKLLSVIPIARVVPSIGGLEDRDYLDFTWPRPVPGMQPFATDVVGNPHRASQGA